MEPLVSVIIPVYNVLPYLREALDSVINQTYKNLEILVVDDGSTDGSGEVCDEYLSDPRVIVIHQENKGLSGARNTGLDRMTGEYVAFLDSDDAFMPEMIEKMLDAMVRNQVSAAMCGFIACFTNSNMRAPNTRRNEQLHYNKERIISSSTGLNMAITNKASWAVWNKLYQHSIWSSIRFPENANYEDMRVMCHVIERCDQIVIVPEMHVLYRQRFGSITRTQNEKNLHDYLIAIRAIDKYVELHFPSVFSYENIIRFRERCARSLSSQYAGVLFHSHSKSIKHIKKDIMLWWKRLEGKPCKFSTKVTHFFFLYAPSIIPPAYACWDFGKQLFRKVVRS